MGRVSTDEHHGLTMANEDYIEAIYRLATEGADDAVLDEGVRSVEIAELLDVSKASVNKAISSLRDAGLVKQTRYGRVVLTELGRKVGAEVWRAHRTLRSFLMRDLGVDPVTADREACLMEHALSHDTMERWLSYMEQQGVQIDG